ncbi:MAG: hypothetical protein ACRD09_04390, partial [Vicinamibacterales bacterium]
MARQLLTETLTLAAAGGGLGLLFAVWIVDLFELRTAAAAAPLALNLGPRTVVL